MDSRLPFPVHGTRYSGDGDDHASLSGDAARVLYFANLIAGTAGVPVVGLRQDIDQGTVSASVRGPLTFKGVAVDAHPQPPTEFPEDLPLVGARLMWVPEGLVFTPRTPAAPDGFGMPPTEDGLGTPGGPLAEVMISQYEYNNYPDVAIQYSELVEKAMASGDVVKVERITAAPVFPQAWELVEGELGIGVYAKDDEDDRKPKFGPQFANYRSLWKPLFREPRKSEWFCHRPQYALPPSEAQQTILDGTNAIRQR